MKTDWFELKDARLQILHQENVGLTMALRRGCSLATGEFIARQDAGDVSCQTRLMKQLNLLRSDASVSLVSCWSRAIGPEDEVLFETQRSGDPGVATERFLAHRQGAVHGTVMFRRRDYERAGGYRHQFYFSQDNDLWFRLLELGQVAFVPETLYMDRISPASISANHRPMQHALGELSYQCHLARKNGESEEPWLHQAASLRPEVSASKNSCPLRGEYFIGRCLARRRDPRARKYLSSVLKKEPWRLGAWLGLCQTILSHGRIER